MPIAINAPVPALPLCRMNNIASFAPGFAAGRGFSPDWGGQFVRKLHALPAGMRMAPRPAPSFTQTGGTLSQLCATRRGVSAMPRATRAPADRTLAALLSPAPRRVLLRVADDPNAAAGNPTPTDPNAVPT